MSISIKRKRYVIVKNDTHILCGLARNYCFKPISNIGNTAIKTYLSKNKAISSFQYSWGKDIDGVYLKVIEVYESLESTDMYK